MIGAPRVTVYIASYNYGKYLEQAIYSVLRQTMQDFELLIFDDGSTDTSKAILARYAEDPRITVIEQENEGLVSIANKAVEQARGDYLIRLDADDFFDENALFVLSSVLDAKPDADLVYSDYYEVDDENNTIGIVRRKKIGEESELLDLPAHGACTMVRTEVMRALGGYSKGLRCQDGYDLWIRFIQEHKPYNVNLPLFYYRKHSESSTTDASKILKARRAIKQRFVATNGKREESCIIIPIRRASRLKEDLPLMNVGGQRLMEYAIRAAKSSSTDKVIVTTEDEEIAGVAREHDIEVIMRPQELAAPRTPIEPTITHVIAELKKQGFTPNIIGVVFYTSPLIKGEHIDEAINTLIIYNADSVVSVKENSRLHYTHGKHGLQPLTKRALKDEREHFYEESGAFIITRRDTLKNGSLTGKRLSHIVLADHENIDIEDDFTLWLVRKALEDQEELGALKDKKIRRGY